MAQVIHVCVSILHATGMAVDNQAKQAGFKVVQSHALLLCTTPTLPPLALAALLAPS